MKLRRSRTLEALRRGGNATCAKLNLSDPRVVEIVGLARYDCAWLCNEHVPNDWLNLEHQIRAAKLHDMDTMVRVEKGSYSDFVRPFEADATGIMVPHVSTADEARQIVQWTRFHPIGRRALDGGNADCQYCQVPLKDYLHHTNTERFIALQIESPEALANVDQIAAVEGFDMLVFGPGDFSQLIGKPGQINDPEVIAARKKIGEAARKHGKFAMSPGMLADRKTLEAEGFKMLSLGADVIAIADYFQKAREKFEGAAAAVPSAPKAGI
jgi:4-hydroxy-2-oxoheptanedioate aldolase